MPLPANRQRAAGQWDRFVDALQSARSGLHGLVRTAPRWDPVLRCWRAALGVDPGFPLARIHLYDSGRVECRLYDAAGDPRGDRLGVPAGGLPQFADEHLPVVAGALAAARVEWVAAGPKPTVTP